MLMSIFTGDLWSRWVEVWYSMLCDFTCFRAVTSSAKFYPKAKGYNFQKAFHGGGCAAFPA